MRISTHHASASLALLSSLTVPTCHAQHDDAVQLPLPLPHSQAPSSDPDNTTLLITAVLNSPSPPYHAVIECWALSSPFSTYPTVGKALSLGDTSNVTYVVLPPRSAEGWHRPPANMYFILLSGAAHVHAPFPERQKNDQYDHLYIKPDQNQVLIAIDSDLRAPGHLTYYPGATDSVALQVPFRDGKIPEHVFVRAGACDGPTKQVHGDWWGDDGHDGYYS